ncbi:MAG: hypothetical protein L0H20_04255 [Corynebacterium sp.]|uniref:hypothetical protein n=1 Tax=Corynebacterium sp. TaxID=1720 RepID=UPI002648E569|nr:hypothetical protein [Corynebacterium sp.]MDN5722205.1 hypothetical protein [Corynebacterium sp.]
MPSPGYSPEFKQQVVDRFTGYFEASSTLTSAAASSAGDFGVATSTVLTWAEEQERMPRPTWGEIRRLRAANAHLTARLRELEGQ